jgi:hypothetical protein
MDDGRTLIVPSQSWLNTAMNCPEQARMEMLGVLPRVETDATAIGTAMHAGIEAVLRDGLNPEDGVQHAIAEFTRLTELDEFRWVQIKTMDTAVATVQRVFWSWANEILPQLPDTIAIEHKFDEVLYENDSLQVRLQGAIDFIGEDYNGNPCVWDWKTANRPYEAWEKERWAIQPTVYTYALSKMYGGDNYEFTYAICLKSRQDTQLVTVTRHSGHWDWMREQIASVVHLVQADLPRWPLRDQSALCSPKWCSNWDNCKGAHI